MISEQLGTTPGLDTAGRPAHWHWQPQETPMDSRMPTIDGLTSGLVRGGQSITSHFTP